MQDRSRVIHFVGPGHEVGRDLPASTPHAASGSTDFGDLANLLGDLRIAGQIEDKLRVGRAKQPFR